jgi:hypothetical protein
MNPITEVIHRLGSALGCALIGALVITGVIVLHLYIRELAGKE